MSSPFYRPTTFSPKFGAEAPTPLSGSSELGHAGFSAGVETQLTSPADISKAHTFFKPPLLDAKALAAPAMVPGAEHAAMSMLPGVPGANEISPLIQLIMRLPGHIGLMNSFFEALGHLFNPDLTMFGSLDPTILSHQAHAAFESLTHAAGEHLPIDPSILPSDAPIFHTAGHDLLSSAHHGMGLDEATGKLNSSAAEHLDKNPLNCAGEYDLSKPHFESSSLTGQGSAAGSSGLLSGPQMSGSAPANYLAGQGRIFSDKLFGGNNLMASAGSQGGSQALPSSLNVSANTLGQQASSLPSASGGAGDMSRQSFGPSGAVSEKLGGQSLLAQGSGSFDSNTFTPTGSAASSGAESASAAAGEQGLKATQLTLPGVPSPHAPSAPHAHHVMDHIGHQTKVVPHVAHNGVDEVSHRSLLKNGDSQAHVAHTGEHAGHFQHKPEHQPGKMLKEADAAKPASTDKIAQADTTRATDAPVGSDAASQASYTVRPGDCLWNIAKNHGLRWQDIYNMNSDVLGKNPNLIFPGVEIKLPAPGSDLASAAGDLSKHIVKPGDSLWKIAQDHLGNGQHWGQIYQINHNIVGANPRMIFPGQELSIPGTGGATSHLASAPVSSAPTTVAQATPPVSAPVAHDSTSIAPSTSGTEGVMDSAVAVPTAAPAQMAGQAGRLPAFNSESLAPSSLRPDLNSLFKGRK